MQFKCFHWLIHYTMRVRVKVPIPCFNDELNRKSLIIYRKCLAIYHLMSNAHSLNNCLIYNNLSIYHIIIVITIKITIEKTITTTP